MAASPTPEKHAASICQRSKPVDTVGLHRQIRLVCFHAATKAEPGEAIEMPANKPVFARSWSVTRRPCLPFIALAAAVVLGAASSASAADAVRGVTDTEIVIGSITDLSGVTAIQAVNNVDAVRLAFDEANANGGVHGRKFA